MKTIKTSSSKQVREIGLRTGTAALEDVAVRTDETKTTQEGEGKGRARGERDDGGKHSDSKVPVDVDVDVVVVVGVVVVVALGRSCRSVRWWKAGATPIWVSRAGLFRKRWR